MKKGIALAVGFICLLLSGSAQSNKDYFSVEGIIQAEGGSGASATIVVSRGGKGKKTFTPKPDGKYSFELDFQSTYDLEFMMDGYITRTININTQVPKEVLEDGVMPFFMDILLYKAFDGMKNETASVSFNERDYGFRFDKSYMQTLKSQKKEIDQLKAGTDLELQANFDAAIRKADGLFNSKDYANARVAYTEALTLKSSELYPKNKISDIDRILNELAMKEKNEKELNAKYEAAVTKGNSAFNSSDYTGAKDAFTEANTLKPTEPYPISKLDEINRILGEMAQKEAGEKELSAKYTAAIQRGDNAFKTGDYATARTAYTEASGLKPGEAYPKDQLDAINRIQEELAMKDAKEKELNTAYGTAIQRGDNAFAGKNYTDARAAYNDALTLKANEEYPKGRIAEIDRILGELALKEQNEKELRAKYDDAVNRGNALFTSMDYTNARTAYQEALTYQPNENYPKTRIGEIDKALAEIALKESSEKELNAKYAAAVKRGDDAFGNQDYTTARNAYNEASILKSFEQYPKDRITEIDRILGEIAQKEAAEKDIKAKYDDAVKRGDAAFGRKDYVGARSAYNEALVVKAGEQYPKDKIAEIDRIMNEIAQKEANEKDLKARYDAAIQQGDQAFGNKDYTAAKTSYSDALTLKPAEKYPKDRIAEIDRIMAEIALKESKEKELNAKYDAAVKRGDDAFATKDYTAARTGYNDAIALKPGEQYAKNKITEIDRVLREIAEREAMEKELQGKYEAAIKLADDAFRTNDMAAARMSYKDALGFKPNEQYPQDQLKEIDRLEEERLKKEKEELLQAELERLRKLNNITPIKTEEERLQILRNGERAALSSSGYIVLKPYDTVEQLGSKYFGYINFGSGGNIEITKEEFDRYKVMFNK